MGVRDSELLRQGWPAGVDNRTPETDVPPEALRQAVNVDLSDAGKPRRRTGYTLAAAGDAHSLYGAGDALLAVVDGTLTAFDRNLAASTIRTGLPEAPISYARIGASVYWSNGHVIRRLTDEYADAPLWPSFAGQPTVAPHATGGLHAGTYQVAVTYIDEDGRESGTDLAALVDLVEGQGIHLTDIPVNPDANRVRIYVSQANSETLYFARDIPSGLTSYILGVGQRGKALETQLLDLMPPGEILRLFNGRLLVAAGRYLWWSEPLRYGLRHHDNYVRFGDITLVEPMGEGPESGAYVADGARTYWMPGADPKNWSSKIVMHSGAVKGSALQVSASLLGLEYSGFVPYWLANDGVFCAGLPGGNIVRITQDRFVALANAGRGATLLRDQNGIRQLLTSIQGGTVNTAAATDSAVATVRRNGVIT